MKEQYYETRACCDRRSGQDRREAGDSSYMETERRRGPERRNPSGERRAGWLRDIPRWNSIDVERLR